MQYALLSYSFIPSMIVYKGSVATRNSITRWDLLVFICKTFYAILRCRLRCVYVLHKVSLMCSSLRCRPIDCWIAAECSASHSNEVRRETIGSQAPHGAIRWQAIDCLSSKGFLTINVKKAMFLYSDKKSLSITIKTREKHYNTL